MIAVIYDLLLVIPLCVASASLLHAFFGVQISAPLYLAVNIIAAVYSVIMKHSKLRERLLIAGITVTAFLAALFYHPAGSRVEFLKGQIWVLTDIVIALACFALYLLSKHHRLIRIIAALILLILLPVFLFTGYDVQRITVTAIFFLFIITLIDEVQQRSRKDGNSDPKRHLVFTCPFVIAVFTAASLLTAPDKPYDWGFVRSALDGARSIVARINDMFTGVDWDSTSPVIGFSDRGNLGGNLSGGGYTVMDIVSSGQCEDELYMTGRVFSDFDGQEWTGADTDDLTDRGYDTLETLSAIIDASDGTPLADNARSVSLTETSRGFRDARLFVPAKLVPGSVKKPGAYHLAYYRLNMTSPVITDILEQDHEITKDSWDLARSECFLDEVSEYDYDGYSAYRDRQYETYLPKTVISDRMRAYTDDLLAGASSSYEKLIRIEEMLRGFHYTDSPGALPDTLSSASDYLDWFIFEKKEGYCSYYATSFVLLARAYGIPARYVQGYRTGMAGKLHADVDSTDAHAWPEAYIDGFGWMAFEPTPGIESGRANSSWKSMAELTAQGKELYDTTGHADDDSSVTGDLSDTGGDSAKDIRWSAILIPVLIGALFTAMLFLIDMLIKRARYNKLPEHERSLAKCRRCLLLLKRRGFARGGNETLSEYRSRMSRQIQPRYLDFLPVYEKLLYSGREITADESKLLDDTLLGIRSAGRKVIIVHTDSSVVK